MRHPMCAVLPAVCCFASLCHTAQSEPPLTTKARAEAARQSVQMLLDSVTDSYKRADLTHVKLKPRIVAVRETDPLNHRMPLEVKALFTADKNLAAEFHCDVHGDAMVVDGIAFMAPYHQEEAHPSRNKSLDQLQDLLQAYLELSVPEATDRAKVMDHWNTHRSVLFQIGTLHEFKMGEAKYLFWAPRSRSKPGIVHISITP